MPEVCKLYDLKKLAKAKARVMVAKDVLARLRVRNVKTDIYLYIPPKILNFEDGASVCDARSNISKLEKCEACALGNMFLSHIRLYNMVSLDASGEVQRRFISSKLQDYFNSDQLSLIETAFEGGQFTPYNNARTQAALSYYQKYRSDKKRLKAIMLNIIRNKGTFIPTDYRNKKQKHLWRTHWVSI